MNDPGLTDLLAGYKYANDMTIQLLTLSSGILTLSITFMRDIVKEGSVNKFLIISWGLFLASILFGILTMGMIAGDVFMFTEYPGMASSGISWSQSVAICGVFQFTFFFFGLVFLMIFGIQTLRAKKPSAVPQEKKAGVELGLPV